MPLNTKQLIATDPNKNIWLSANAGTGKTFVLAHRYLRLILDDNDANHIVCITYTKAAASEMKERIVKFIAELLLLDDAGFINKINADYNISISKNNLKNIRSKLSVLLDNPDFLKINTIHSFCQTILKSFPMESGIPPFFSVIDNYQTAEIEQKAWNLVTLNQNNQQTLDSLNFLLARFQLNSLKENLFELKKISNKIFETIEKQGDLNSYLIYLKQVLNIEDEDLFEEEMQLHNNLQPLITTINELVKNGDFTDKNTLKPFFNYLKTRSYDDLYLVFYTNEENFRSSYKKLAKDFPVIHEQVLYFSEKVKSFNELRKNILCFQTTKHHLVILKAFCEEYENFKKLKYLLEYEDLINITANLLSSKNQNSPWVLYKLDGGIDHILLDESQDTSPSQWKVIEAITEEFFAGAGTKERKRSLFIVGDEKQSIYSFQGADINVFNSKKDFYKNIKQLSEQNQFEFISINTSYRSSEAILKIVDETLKNEKIRSSVSKSDIIDFHEISRKKTFGYFEINNLCGEKPKRADSEKIEWFLPSEYAQDTTEKNKDILAKQVTARIVEILNRNYPLAETSKAPKASDIMILLRKRDEFAYKLIAEIQKNNIKISGIDRLYLNENIVIKDIISLVKFSNMPNDNLNLACLLKSPIFELSEEQLFDLCWNRGALSLIENIKIKSPELYQKLNSISLTSENGLYNFFYNLLEVDGLRKNFISYYGTQINEIIDEFLTIVENFEDNNSRNISDFINWFEKNLIEIKRNLNNKSSELRIITAHGSKGLEAPIVIIPDSTSAPNKTKSYGFIYDVFLCPMRSEYKNSLFKKSDEKQRNDAVSEYLRLLYVALTRARDELYIFGTHEYSPSPDNWHNLVLSSIEGICDKADDKLIFTNQEYHNAQILEHDKDTSESKLIELKNFDAEKEVEIISPSKLIYIEAKTKLGQNNQEMTRGVLIHKLLEMHSQLQSENSELAFNNIFSQFSELSEDEILEIKTEVLNNINNQQFSFLFNANSLNEVTIFGYDNDKIISGKIDKIIIEENTISIIDFKTTKIKSETDAERLAEKYIPQLNSYKNLVQKIYPDKKVKAGVLFTNIAKLVWF